jgi:YbbR domain-containing protein
MAKRELITKNFRWKMLSLLLAALAWVVISTTLNKDQILRQSPVITTSERQFTSIPITLLTAASNTNQFKVTPSFVDIKVNGKKDELERLQLREVTAFVDLTGTPDEEQFRRNIQVRVPREFTVASGAIEPAFVFVERVTEPR